MQAAIRHIGTSDNFDVEKLTGLQTLIELALDGVNVIHVITDTEWIALHLSFGRAMRTPVALPSAPYYSKSLHHLCSASIPKRKL